MTLSRGIRLLWTAVLMGLAASSGISATFLVSKTADTWDGSCDSDCSLREAVIAANVLPGPDTITLPAGSYTLTIPGIDESGLTGDLDITEGLSILGAGSAGTIIDGGALDRVFHVHSDYLSVINLAGITIQNGNSVGDGGGIGNGFATLNLARCVLRNNFTFGGGGGLVSAAGTVTLSDSIVQDNISSGGGGISNGSGPLTITGSQILGNRTSVGAGGGILNSAGELTIIRTVVSGNFAGGSGGGIQSGGFPGNRPHTLRESTLSNNMTSSAGGGLASLGAWAIENSTISSNQANLGGGMHVLGGNANVLNSTWNLNSAILAGGIHVSAGVVVLRSTIVANSPSGGNCNGPIVSAGDNLSSDVTCAAWFTAASDRNSADPLLGPLAVNGGSLADQPLPAPTHALLPGSPAIDAAGGCPPPATDQRGVARPQGVACDIGSFEVESGTLPTGIPTLSVAAMVLLALALAAAGGWIARR